MDKGLYGPRDRLVKEKEHDPYREQEKWSEPTVCTWCGALFTDGRRSWREAPVSKGHRHRRSILSRAVT